MLLALIRGEAVVEIQENARSCYFLKKVQEEADEERETQTRAGR